LATGWAALRAGDAAHARAIFSPAEEEVASGEALEGLARTCYLEADFTQAIERVRQAERVERFTGGSVHNFLREPFGPGWALVGDAGHTKDPITGHGISDAFLDAEVCAAALDQALSKEAPFDEVMAEYQRSRDARVVPMYEFTAQIATLEPPPPDMQRLIGAMASNQPAMDGFVSVVAGTLSPQEFFDPANIGRLMAAGATA